MKFVVAVSARVNYIFTIFVLISFKMFFVIVVVVFVFVSFEIYFVIVKNNGLAVTCTGKWIALCKIF